MSVTPPLASNAHFFARFASTKMPAPVTHHRVAFGRHARITPLKPLKPMGLDAVCGSRFADCPVVVHLAPLGSIPFLRRKGACKKG